MLILGDFLEENYLFHFYLGGMMDPRVTCWIFVVIVTILTSMNHYFIITKVNNKGNK